MPSITTKSGNNTITCDNEDFYNISLLSRGYYINKHQRLMGNARFYEPVDCVQLVSFVIDKRIALFPINSNAWDVTKANIGYSLPLDISKPFTPKTSGIYLSPEGKFISSIRHGRPRRSWQVEEFDDLYSCMLAHSQRILSIFFQLSDPEYLKSLTKPAVKKTRKKRKKQTKSAKPKKIKDKKLNIRFKILNKAGNKGKPIIDSDGTIWPSLSAASQALGIQVPLISMVCNHKLEFTHGMSFEFLL
jgi:hypothetical protein